MRNNLLTIAFLLIALPCFAGDYVCHDDGTITTKHISCGRACSSRPECLKITRSKIESITKWYKVDTKIIGTNDQKVIEMTQEEKDLKDVPTQAQIDALAKITTLKLKLKDLGFTDEEINMLLSNY